MKALVIAGPTGVGKTELSIELAKEINAEIISADSMQVYKYLNIGTAKIKENEMQNIPHHMINIIEPKYKFSVGEYFEKVNKILKKIEEKNKSVVLTGGTGLYINSITEGLSNLPKKNDLIRNELNQKSNEELFEILKNIDPESAESIHINNKLRLIRAIEVYKLSGERFSFLSKQNLKGNNFNFIKIGLERDRNILYDRINKRVDIMFEDGLIDEARNLYLNFKDDIIKIRAIAYPELFDYFDKKISLEETKELIKRNSRRYAKRQFTWFKNDDSITWINLDNYSLNDAKDKILKIFNDSF